MAREGIKKSCKVALKLMPVTYATFPTFYCPHQVIRACLTLEGQRKGSPAAQPMGGELCLSCLIF